MTPSSAPAFGNAADLLGVLAMGLAADAAQTGRKTLEVIRSRSPELVRVSEDTGEDLIATSDGFVDVLLTSLRSAAELPWSDYERRTRDYGRLKAAQGIPLETLIDVLAVFRRATIELITQPIEGTQRRDEIYALAQSRLEDVVERLTTWLVRSYLEHLDVEHRNRESELYGLAAIVTSMGRSLDMAEIAEVALVETLAALRLSAGALWMKEREVALAERHDRKLSLMMIDLDNLKRINDRQGHSAGDAALRLIAQQLQRVVRASDICARIGGDEFGVAMPETDLLRAREVAYVPR